MEIGKPSKITIPAAMLNRMGEVEDDLRELLRSGIQTPNILQTLKCLQSILPYFEAEEIGSDDPTWSGPDGPEAA